MPVLARPAAPPSTAKPNVRPSRSSSATSPAARCPKRKFSPTTTSAACRCSTSTSWTNSSASSCENAGVNGTHAEHVDAERLDQLGLARRLGEHRRVRPGPDHLGRVRVERHHHRLHAQLPGPLHGVPDDLLVPPVHAVEDADGDDRAAPATGCRLDPRHRCMPFLPHSVPVAAGGGDRRLTPARARPRAGARPVPLPDDRDQASVRAEDGVRPGDADRGQRATVREHLGLMRWSPSRRGKNRVAAAAQRQGDHGPARARSSSSRVAASARVNPPTAVRRSAVRWPPTPSAGAEVSGERPDVRAGRAATSTSSVHTPARSTADRQHVQPGDGDRRAASATSSPARTRCVGALAVTLIALTALGTWSISPVNAAASADRIASSVTRAGGRGGHDLALGVVGDRGLPQPDRRGVRLVRADHVGEQPGRPLDADDQHAGGHRVEGAAVPDPAGARQPAHPRHHVVRGHPGGLVHHDQPVGCSRAHPPRPSWRPSLPDP